MDKVIAEIVIIAKKYFDIKRVMLFGSRARGDENKNSDYDIAIFGASTETKRMLIDDVDKIPTLHKIDLLFVENRHIGTDIYNSIIKEGIDLMNKFEIKLSNYKKAVIRLREALDIAKNNDFDIIKDGVIQRFEFTTELSWKALREYLILEGEIDINSPKSTMKAAFRMGLITDEIKWLKILDDRNITSHIYDEDECVQIFERIRDDYIELFENLLKKLENKRD